MKIEKVSGINTKHKVFLYAISTCVWCKRTKQFMRDNSIEFEYVDVDLLGKEELAEVDADLKSRGAIMIFPLVIVDNETIVYGDVVNKLKKLLEL
jgi:glutaredoxin-like protein NrdH